MYFWRKIEDVSKSAFTGGRIGPRPDPGPDPACRFFLPAWLGGSAPPDSVVDVVVVPPAPVVVVNPPAKVVDVVVVPPGPVVVVDPPAKVIDVVVVPLAPVVVVNPAAPAVVVETSAPAVEAPPVECPTGQLVGFVNDLSSAVYWQASSWKRIIGFITFLNIFFILDNGSF